jgi:hypothetical protein
VLLYPPITGLIRNIGGGGTLTTAERTGTARHETGHHFDKINGFPSTKGSNSNFFINVGRDVSVWGVSNFNAYIAQSPQNADSAEFFAFLSDGGEDVRSLQLYMNPQAEHVLDWFHITMRLTVLQNCATGVKAMNNKNRRRSSWIC